MLKILGCSIAATVLASSAGLCADASHGEQIARRWCASCHVVAPDQHQTTGEAPPFTAIARAPDFNASRLAFFLLDPHPKMPDMSLTRTEAADLAAYIASRAIELFGVHVARPLHLFINRKMALTLPILVDRQ